MQVRSQTAPHPDLFPSIARRGLGTQPQRARRARRKGGYWEEHVLRRGQGERRAGWEPRPSTPLWVPVFTGTTTISVRAAPSADGERADTWVRPYQINRGGRGAHPHLNPLPSEGRGGGTLGSALTSVLSRRGERRGIHHPHPSPLPSRERGSFDEIRTCFRPALTPPVWLNVGYACGCG